LQGARSVKKAEFRTGATEWMSFDVAAPEDCVEVFPQSPPSVSVG
jgi:hypothetical protein